MVVIQVNTVHKSVDEPLLALLRGDVDLAEVGEREQYLFLCQHRIARLRLEQLYFEIALALLQLVQRLLRRGRIDALRDCLDKVVQLGFYARELCLYRSCCVIFPQLQFINAVGKLFNHFVA